MSSSSVTVDVKHQTINQPTIVFTIVAKQSSECTLYSLYDRDIQIYLRDRPFNLKGEVYDFLFRSEFFFRTTQELEYLFFLSREAQIVFLEYNIRLYDKNSESDFFFPPPKSEYFVQQHWESEYFFRKKP
jgi:hypothetical protein